MISGDDNPSVSSEKSFDVNCFKSTFKIVTKTNYGTTDMKFIILLVFAFQCEMHMTLADMSDVRPESALLAGGAESCLSAHTTKQQVVAARVVSHRIVRGAIGSLIASVAYARRFSTIDFFDKIISIFYLTAHCGCVQRNRSITCT